jgi:hypothetical protein
MYKVLIVSLANYDALAEFPVLLKKGGVTTVDVFCAEDSWLKKNKYWDNWIKGYPDKETSIQILRHIFETKAKYYDWIILGDDPTIRFMHEVANSDELFFNTFPVNTKAQVVALINIESLSPVWADQLAVVNLSRMSLSMVV